MWFPALGNLPLDTIYVHTHLYKKDQSKVYFKNEHTGRYFVTFYTEPPMKLGWTTFVYILDNKFDKLGSFGV